MATALPRAKKSLGQNFLQDKNIARKIVECLDIHSDDAVIEIGPGPGMLTSFILEKNPKRLVLLEKDHHLACERQAKFISSGKSAMAQAVLCDAMEFQWERLTSSWKVIGNLPYNIASPLMWDIFSIANGLARAVFMVQKEVGLRLKAEPSTSDYGALSVWTQCYVKPKLEFIVPPQVFVPQPKVHSAVVSFDPIELNKRPKNPKALSRLLKACFQQRRKQLGNIFKQNNIPLSILEKKSISLMARPEELSPDIFMDLSLLL